ncbi:MAG: hypothetical protein DHS20C15_26220 [Planctomycetota bacterium]|nr:MAG: hypothetical protein DHS20C15_26220 [Planctomycetota bacterium]
MNPVNPKDLLFEALDRPADARAAFLEQACAGDAALHARVLALLAAHAAADTRLGVQTPDFAALAGAAGIEPGAVLRPGDHVGVFELLEVLGEGGFGTVYRARQEQPVQREVALKVVKAGMDTAAVLSRFEAERQALALMDHPSIARVLEVGATESGRPYFAMELVSGQHLTRYAREQRLDLRARLRLFLQVCQALQHAHQKGVVHRDVKAGNVIVTEVDGAPVPKIIDFGIAKAVRGGDMPSGELTGEGHLLGTPSTMSPEQLAGGPDVDTRADVYALGLLLYELLTDTPAFDLATRSLDEIRRVVREEQPLRPSKRRLPSSSAVFELPADLDWICLRCLEKERDRRYATAQGLAQDVERFLAHLPVEAAPPSAVYRTRKLLRRHRASALAGAVLLAALLVALYGLDAGRRLADREAAEARRQAALARETLRFFTKDLLAAAVPSGQPGHGREVRVVDVLRLADARLASRSGAAALANSALVETALRRSVGQSWAALGQYEAARAQLSAALEALLVDRGALDTDTLITRQALADVLRGLGDFDGAETQVDAVQRALVEQPGSGADRERASLALQAKRLRGLVQLDRGELVTAQASLQAVVDEAADFDGDLHLDALDKLGLAHAMSGDYGPAVDAFARAYAGRLELLGPRDPFTLATQLNHGNALRALDRLDDARREIDAAVNGLVEVLGPQHPDTLVARHARARVRLDAGELDAAEALLTPLLADMEAVLGSTHLETLDVLSGLTILNFTRGDVERAEGLARRALEGSRESLGPEHPRTLERANELAATLYAQGRFDEVAPLVTANLHAQEATLGRDHPSTLQSLVNLALLHLGLEEYARAEELLLDARERFAARAEPLFAPELSMLANLAGLHGLQARHADAERVAREALARLELAQLEAPDLHAHLLERRGNALAGLGRVDEAQAELRRAWEVLTPSFGPDAPRARDVAAALVALLEQHADDGADGAEDNAQQALWRARAYGDPGDG